MIGSVAFHSAYRRIVLLTPSGKGRAHDIICSEIWFHVAGLGEPYIGQIVQFDLSTNPGGQVEAIKVRPPELLPPEAGINGGNADAKAGAVAGGGATATAGINSEAR